MIPLDRAVALVLDSVRPLGMESVDLADADRRVLARPIKARLDLPRFDQSAMDGVALRSQDVPPRGRRGTLDLAGEMPAGTTRRLRLAPGASVRVFTGSPLPAGADAVVMQEHCEFGEGTVTPTRAVMAGDHIRRRGEEVRRGDLLLDRGERLGPAAIGLLASHGIDRIPVTRRPKVALLTMGDEVVAPGRRLAPGKIRDANGPALAAALRRAGAAQVRHRHAQDDPAQLHRLLGAAIRSADVVVTVGGASVGCHDHVADARKRLGVLTLFENVAMKPGKPNLFGLARDGTPVFSLPGNPVSALVSCALFVAPALGRMQGEERQRPSVRARLATELSKKPGRLELVRATLAGAGGDLVATPTHGQGSHMLGGLAAADGLIEFPADATCLKAGESVAVRLLDR